MVADPRSGLLDIVGQYLCTEAALLKERADVCMGLSLGKRPSYLVPALPAGATFEDIDAYFEHCRSEAELAGCLFAIAAAEARLRRDARQRCVPGRSGLDGRLALLHGNAAAFWRVPFDEQGIVDAWKAFLHTVEGASLAERSRWAGRVGQFKSVLNLRHWVAHGRYWMLPPHLATWSLTEIAKVVQDMFQALNDAADRARLPVVP
ncbi:Uncharacterised protein [Bordetella ansorpii]|uniref:RiboL-PSP-HEPN domain-containing protein n=1 Tax=Bordetella ansorpii TaxID=288768 RepID=A0A157Q018_9BORD|nr:hypothetical protein [Bordetella ansorpii]SAI39245.1 Uncharacterised protein [Bordetella ansorpii]